MKYKIYLKPVIVEAKSENEAWSNWADEVSEASYLEEIEDEQ